MIIDKIQNEDRRDWMKIGLEKFGKKGLQTIHTPFTLCEEIINKLEESIDLTDKQIAVLFNLEFLEILREKGINFQNVTFFSDCDFKNKYAKKYNVKEVVIVSYNKESGINFMPKPKKQFDVVIMNPPYQAPSATRKGTTGGSIWDKFIPLALEITTTNGCVAAVHPAMWRKPDQSLLSTLTQLDMIYLEMHSEQDGRKTFGAGTNYDWYICRNTPGCGKTVVVNYDGEQSVRDLRNVPFIANSNEEDVDRIVTTNEHEACEVLYSRSDYGTDKTNMSKKKKGKFKHPCVHEMNQNGYGYWYSSKKSDFFTPKVILSVGRHQYPLFDEGGEFGMSQNCFAIKVSSKKEGKAIVRAINSDRFKALIAATKWGAFQTDWRMFKYFRKDFWKEFV